LTEADAWLIAYPDQFGPDGLGSVGEVVDALSPGINGVHVLPFHPSSSDGGFAVQDYDVVDPAFGSWEDVTALATRHRLMADAVINHVSAQGTWFGEWLSGDPNRDGYFRAVPGDADLGAVVRPRPGAPTVGLRRGGDAVDVWATFGPDQVDLDYRTPAVLLDVVRALLKYVEHGAHAIRLDAVAYLWKEPGRASIHEPETHSLVAILRSVLDDIDPGIVLITETNVPHVDNVAYFGTAAAREADAVYQFPLAPLMLHAVQTGDTRPIVSWLRSVDPPENGTFLNFLASHDGVGVRPARGWLSDAQIDELAQRCRSVGGVVNEASTADGAEPYELAATWFSLCGAGVDEQMAQARHAASHAVMLALVGVPLLYAHSLTMAVNDVGRASASGSGRDLNRGRYASPVHFLGEVAGSSAGSTIGALLESRRRTTAFDPASMQQVLEAPEGVVAIERASEDERSLVVVNLRDTPVQVEIGDGWRFAVTDRPIYPVLALPPYGVFWS
jgi:sucrose phosphorylase